jgi:uncharacterized membrane protein YuzA (DUF378 family)
MCRRLGIDKLHNDIFNCKEWITPCNPINPQIILKSTQGTIKYLRIKNIYMQMVGTIAWWLVIVGALNWGLTVLGMNLVTMIFGAMGLETIVYALVGLSAVYLLLQKFKVV